jgi:hypothetical protein
VVLTVRNTSTKGGVPTPATLKVGISSNTDLVTLIPIQVIPEEFGANEEKKFTFTMSVPADARGTGVITAWVEDPTGTAIASATEEVIIQAVVNLNWVTVYAINNIGFQNLSYDTDGTPSVELMSPTNAKNGISVSFCTYDIRYTDYYIRGVIGHLIFDPGDYTPAFTGLVLAPLECYYPEGCPPGVLQYVGQWCPTVSIKTKFAEGSFPSPPYDGIIQLSLYENAGAWYSTVKFRVRNLVR